MTEEFYEEAGARRQIHINQIGRMKEYTLSEDFKDACAEEIEAKREFVEKAYERFMKEHGDLVHFMTKDRFQRADEKLQEVERMYQEVIIKFRVRLREIEQNEAIERQKQIQEVQKLKYKNVRKNEADSNSEETTDKLREVAIKAMMANRDKKKASEAKCSAGPSNALEQTPKNTEQSRFEQKEENISESFENDKGNFNAAKEDARLLIERKKQQERDRFTENLRKNDEMCMEVEQEQEKERQENRDRQVRQTRQTQPHPIFGCHVCDSQNHPMRNCPYFKQMSIYQRTREVDYLNLCRNCFAKNGRWPHTCNKARHGPCRLCPGVYHNSLLCPRSEQP